MTLTEALEAYYRGNYNDVIDTLKHFALKGDLQSAYILGDCYVRGLGTDINYQEALRWLKETAQRNHKLAQRDLAQLYRSGKIGRDYETAVKWFQMAAESGETFSMYELSEMYFYGLGVPKSLSNSTKWLRKAADNGHGYAQAELGRRLIGCHRVKKNLVNAYKWSSLGGDLPEKFAKKHGMTKSQVDEANEKIEKWRQAHVYPKGCRLFCLVYYSIKYLNKPALAKGYLKEFSAVYPLYDDPISGFAYAVQAVQNARYNCWWQWVAYKTELEAKSDVEAVFTTKREFWTNQNSDKTFVTGFVRKFGDLPDIPSDF